MTLLPLPTSMAPRLASSTVMLWDALSVAAATQVSTKPVTFSVIASSSVTSMSFMVFHGTSSVKSSVEYCGGPV
jgi:predicted neutral ceramidase superfamily lipid hydrolase